MKEFRFDALFFSSMLLISVDVPMSLPAVLIRWTQLGLLEQTLAFNMLTS